MNKKPAVAFVAVALAVYASILGAAAYGERYPAPAKAGIQVGFAPGGTALKLVIDLIGQARSSILVACYEFTDRDMAAAIEEAAHRGVKVRIVADGRAAKAKYSQVSILGAAGIPIRIATRYAIMHDKFMVVDGVTVETGSFNYTTSAYSANAENVIVLRNVPELAKIYGAEWQRLWDEAP